MTTKKMASYLAWICAVTAVLILIVGLYFQSTWWMLSTPVALVGAIAGGVSRRYVAMAICIAVMTVLFLVMLVFAP